MRKIRRFAGILYLENFSALAWGAGLGAAIGCSYLPRWVIFLLVPGVILLKNIPRIYFVFAFLLSLASGISYFQRQLAREEIFARPGWIQGEVTICDHRATRVEGIRLRSRVRGELRVPNQKETLPVLLTLTPELLRSGVLFGDRFAVSGILQTPMNNGYYFDGRDISGTVPPAYGENYLLQLEEATALCAESGFVRRCFRLREILLKRLISGIREPENQSMAARLFLGASDGGTPEIRRNFVLAGIIHLFAVSGMHVGVLALVFRIIFGFLKFRIRNILLALVVTVYVMCSGLAIPALRAGAMIVCWCLLRAFLFYTPTWNILSFSFFLLCVISPEAVGELGTQYSYGITAALLLGLSRFREWQKMSGFQFEFMPSVAALTFRTRRNWLRRQRLATLLMAALIAFASGTMLTALNNALFLPGSIFTNLSTVLVTPFMFGIFVFKMGFGWCLESIGARLIEAGFAVLKMLSLLSLEIFSPEFSVKPEIWLVMLFYLLFFAAIICRKRLPGMLMLCGALLIVFSVPLQKQFLRERLIVVAGSSGHPPLLICAIPAQSRAIVCNLPDSAGALSAACELQKLGCGEAELFFSSGNSAASAGAKAFASRIKVSAICLPKGKHTAFFKKNLAAIPDAGSLQIVNFTDRRQPEISGNMENFTWTPQPGVTIGVMKMDDGWRIVADSGEVVIPWSSSPLVWSSVR